MTASPISPDALEAAHWLIAGTTGSGKTYLARGLLEKLRRAGRRVGAVDPRAKLWGLTISADAQGEGLEFVIFGGRRPGAVPMRPEDGARIGRLFVERNIPAIFDLSQWRAREQESWVAAFGDAVFATNETALHLMLDEVQSWTPPNGGGPAYEAVRRLAEQGRGNGVNLLMTAPRLNAVDVGVRQALGGMVAMRQTSTLDRKAAAELIGGHLEVDEKALRAELARLAVGEGIVWSPTGELDRVAFPANTTFDSSRTPRHGDAPPPPIAVSSALVEELRAALAPPADADVDNTVCPGTVALKVNAVIAAQAARITTVEQELAAARAQHAATLAELDRADSVLCAAYDILGDFVAGKISRDLLLMRHERVPRSIELRVPAVVAGNAAGGQLAAPPAALDLDVVDDASRGRTPPAPSVVGDQVAADGTGNTPSAAAAVRGRRALEALVARPEGLTEQQWAWTAELAIGGGTWSTYKGALRAAGLVVEEGGRWRATADGIDAIGGLDFAGSFPELGEELARAWGKRIPGVRRLVEELLLAFPSFRTRQQLAGATGYAVKGGTFSTYLGRLRSAGMLEEQSKGLRLAPAMMGTVK